MRTNRKAQLRALTVDEKLLLPYLERALLKTSETKLKLSDELITELNKSVDKIKLVGVDIRYVNGAMLRKMINHMRCNSTLPIISTSKGYYVSYEIEDINEMIISLTERAKSIEAAAEGLKYIINQKKLIDKLGDEFMSELDKKK